MAAYYGKADREKDLAGFEQFSFQTHSYRPEYSSYPEIRGFRRPRSAERRIHAADIQDVLREKLAFLSGGFDRQGRPIITLWASKNVELDTESEKLSETLIYLTQIPSKEIQSRGFTFVIDLRGATWKSAKPLLRILEDTVPDKIHQIIIIKPDAFWEKRKSDTGIKKEQSNLGYEITVLSSRSKLNQFADEAHLCREYGGTLAYDHEEWIQRRLSIERFVDEAEALMEKLDNLQQDLDTHSLGSNVSDTEELIYDHERKRASFEDVSQPVIKSGRELVKWIERCEPRIPAGLRHSGAPISLVTEEKIQVQGVVNELARKCDQLVDMWEKRRTELMQCRDLKEFEVGFQKVSDWLFDTGEAYLSSTNDIGDSVKSCEFHMRRHEDFELSAREIINLFGQVRELTKKMLQDNHYATRELRSQKDYLDKVCRSFASRMERRKDLVVGSLTFHHNAGKFSSLLDDLLELLCSDAIMMDDLESAEAMLTSLEHKAEAVAQSSEDTLRDGLVVIQLMNEPSTNVHGESVTPDYDNTIQHVQNTLDDLQGRKQRTDELCDVRRLKLQQLLQLRTCEVDAEQAIKWLEQLHAGAVETSADVGRTSEETERLKQEHESVENTAKGTYEYGKQLLQTSLVLRRTCRYEMAPNHRMEESLRQVWEDFSNAMAERGARLSVALMFYRSGEELMQKLDVLRISYIHEYLPGELSHAAIEDAILTHEETKLPINKEYTESVAMGRALIERMDLPDIRERDEVGLSPLHPLEDCLEELEEARRAFEEVWEDKDHILHNWPHVEDYEVQFRELLDWVRDSKKELEGSQWSVGENFKAAQLLSLEFSALKKKVKVPLKK